MQSKILIIEDEFDLVKGLELNLIDNGYDVEYALDGAAGVQKACDINPDLILLDIMLPEMDGLEVCRTLRQKGMNLPILMLTAKAEEIDKIVGLEIGADDYITKPFSIRELLARIKAHLRKPAPNSLDHADIYTIDDVIIDFSKFSVMHGQDQYELTSLEVEILKYLIAHKGEVVHRNQLLNKVWGYDRFPTTRTVDNHIMKLRKKIEKDPTHPEVIVSVYGTGYRFVR